MPTAWFSEGVSSLEFNAGLVSWNTAMLKLLVASVVFATIAALVFRRRFATGLRA
jgi:hypothetical protein